MILPRVFFIALLAGTLAACAKGERDLEQYVDEVKARKTTQIEPIPQIKQYQAFAYLPGTRRDPFVPPEPERPQHSVAGGVRPDVERPRDPLEEFPLDALKLVGVITFENRVYAMVKAPDAVIHRVPIGGHMGQNFGTVIKVTADEVDLKEIVADGFGGFSERPASLSAEEKGDVR